MNEEIIKMLKRMGWVALFFFVIAVIISAVERKSSSLAEEVVVDILPLADGNSLISEGDVDTIIQRSFGYQLQGLPQGSLDVERLERVLEDDPFILDADAFINARNTLEIGIVQREPILRIIDKNKLSYYLDQEAFKMPLSKHFSARVLVATGNIPPFVPDFQERKRHVIKDLFELTQRIMEDPFLYALVEQIYVSNNGDYNLIPKLGQQKIIVGSMYEIAQKLERLKVFYEEAIPYEGWQKYKTVSVKFDDQIICTKW